MSLMVVDFVDLMLAEAPPRRFAVINVGVQSILYRLYSIEGEFTCFWWGYQKALQLKSSNQGFGNLKMASVDCE